MGTAAQFGLMNSLAGEGMAHNIRVNAISPVAATSEEVMAALQPPESLQT